MMIVLYVAMNLVSSRLTIVEGSRRHYRLRQITVTASIIQIIYVVKAVLHR